MTPDSTHEVDAALVGDLARLGEDYDAIGTFPADSLRRLAEAGWHRRFAPPAAGGERFAGPEAQADALALALRRVGRGDLSVGRLFEGHVNALLLFGWYGDEAQAAWLGEALERGAWFGVWATEPPPGVNLNDDGRLHGAKSFASGAGGLDYALVTVAGAPEGRRLAIIAADDEARADVSGWRVRGMRASVSGRYDLTGLCATGARLLGAPGDYDREPRFTAGAWRFCAVQLGGVEALLAETRAALSNEAKGDPVRRARFADALAATRTAGLWVAHAARAAVAERSDAPAVVDLTRGVVERAALDVMEAAARLVGTRSAFSGQRVDKIARDLSLYLRQGGPDLARDRAAAAFLERDRWGSDPLW